MKATVFLLSLQALNFIRFGFRRDNAFNYLALVCQDLCHNLSVNSKEHNSSSSKRDGKQNGRRARSARRTLSPSPSPSLSLRPVRFFQRLSNRELRASHGIGGADEQVRRETGYRRIEGTRHANPSSRCQQPTLYTHTRPWDDRVHVTPRRTCTENNVSRERENERSRERERGEKERDRKKVEIESRGRQTSLHFRPHFCAVIRTSHNKYTG